MVKVHALSRLPRRALSLVASTAMVFAVVPAVTLLTATAAEAAGNPVQVNVSLEACKRAAPAPAKCTYGGAGDTFTPGNLGKNWAELDFVPHRLTLKNNGPDQTFSIEIAADNQLPDQLGYDLIKQGWDSTFNTATPGMFSAGCGNPSVTEENNHENGIVGGVDTTLTDKLTITMAADTTCLVSYEIRLGLGSHQFSGSSLQSQVLNGDDSSAGQMTISLPVKDILPQVATTTAEASTNTDYTWGVTKTGTDSLAINSCLPAPTEPNVSFHVAYTRTAHAASGLTVTGTITLKNPSARTLTTNNITDTVTDSDDGHHYAADVADTTITVPPADADGPGTASTTFSVDIPAPIGTLSNSATVTYDDPDQPGQVLVGLTSASTPVTISVTQTTTNATATLTDDESILSGAGVSFKRTSAPAMSSFATSDEFTKNLTNSGSYDISKIVWSTTPQNGTVVLRDAVDVDPTDGGANADAHKDVTLTVTAANPTVTITKHVDIAPTGANGATFGFTITSNDDPTKSWPASVTIPQGDTEHTGAAVTVEPSASGYSIDETPAPGYSAAATSIDGPVALCGTVAKDVYDTRDLGHVTVTKVLDGPIAGADHTFTFDVSCPSISFTTKLYVTGDGSSSTEDVIPTGTACTIT